MFRKYGPFYSERFIGDTSTMKVHDVYHEKNECEIDFIDHEHIKTFARDRLKTAEENHFSHCPFCINAESYVRLIHYKN